MVVAAKEYIDRTKLKGILSAGKPEQTLVWSEGDVVCRARPDWLTNSHRTVFDYKTTTNAEPVAFARHIASMAYKFQAAFYARGIIALTGRRPEWYWLAQETYPPYACSLHEMTEADWEIYDAQVTRAIALWRECLQSGVWPAYSFQPHASGPAGWEMARHEAAMLEDQLDNPWGN
jgi:hypothetical protein